MSEAEWAALDAEVEEIAREQEGATVTESKYLEAVRGYSLDPRYLAAASEEG